MASDLIMNGTTSGADRSLADGCTPLEEQGGTHCGERHAQLCDSAAMQDSVGELLQLRGPHQPDVVPPRIQILSPAPGSQFVPGQSVTIEVEVDDDYPGHGWRYVVPELAWSARSYGETSLDLQFPPGEFTVRVEAMDQAGNASVAEIQLTVDDSASSDAPSDSDIPPDDIDAATGDDSEAGCRVGGSGPSAPGALAVVFLLWLRARRRALPSTAD
ncbi:MAG: hypothetical protein K0V04_18880 [Deltaproteobacteria bacterium]|nr:hypothetical protein [Deltaproteobacteria bacterium]